MGGLFSFTEAFVSNLRRKNDPLNAFAGGVVAGSVGAIRGVFLRVLYNI